MRRLVLAIVVLHALPARADDDPPSSYRAELFATDALSDFAIVTGFAAGGIPSLVGAGGYLVGAPVIHMRHGHGGRAMASLAMRIALPVAGYWLGGRRMSSDDDDEQFIAQGMLAMSGMLLAQTLDAVLLGGGDEEQVAPPRAMIAPSLAATHGGLALGLGGSF
jgi:hypothetical protein